MINELLVQDPGDVVEIWKWEVGSKRLLWELFSEGFLTRPRVSG
jgi:hypothetical protein